MFLDIIKALQIYVDYSNLCQFFDGYDEAPIGLNVYTGCTMNLSPRNIFILGVDNCKDRNLINLKRVKEAQDTKVHCSLSKLDRSDKLCQNGSDQRKSYLGNLKSSYGDRQRSSFLRDLYIETYPRNGNANGRSTSVLAISNEYYRAPASLLLANANDEHLNAVGILAETNKNQIGISSASCETSNFYKRLSLQQNTESDILYPRNNYLQSNPYFEKFQNNTNNNDLHCLNSNISPLNISLLQLKFQEQLKLYSNKSSMDVRVMNPASGYNIQDSNDVSLSKDAIVVKLSNKTINNTSNTEININNCAKVFNQVLDSPWCPRVPNNYRPFRKKTANSNEKPKNITSVSIARIC